MKSLRLDQCRRLSLAAQRQFQEFGLRVDQQIDEREVAQRDSTWGTTGPMRDFLFMAAPCWRAFALVWSPVV